MFDCLAMEVVDAQIVAWRARDAAAFADFYAPDAVIVMGPDVVISRSRSKAALLRVSSTRSSTSGAVSHASWAIQGWDRLKSSSQGMSLACW